MKKAVMVLIYFMVAFMSMCFTLHLNSTAFALESNYAQVCLNDVTYRISLESIENMSITQKRVWQYSDKAKTIKKIMSMGFSLEQAINYVFPNFETSVNDILRKANLAAQDSTVYANKDCTIGFTEAVNGYEIDKNLLYLDFFNSLENNSNHSINLKILPVRPKIYKKDIINDYEIAGSFYTGFSNSGEARSSNIELATNACNGVIIKNGETVSFNKMTGPRTEAVGYKKAKIIVDGDYIDGFGGGVCQVSSTLYNACLLAGLTITEVHNHTLMSSYVMPGFDAMVNMGSSDLKITNNTGKDCIITGSCVDKKCKFVIHGKKPNYKIVRRYEKYQEIPALGDIIETDISKYPDIDFSSGQYRISYPIDGAKVYSYLDFYNGDVLIKSEKIRNNTYSPKAGKVLMI